MRQLLDMRHAKWFGGKRGYADIRICGYADMRIYGYADIRICRYTDMRICGYTDMRIYGYADMRIYGYADIRICGYSVKSDEVIGFCCMLEQFCCSYHFGKLLSFLI